MKSTQNPSAKVTPAKNQRAQWYRKPLLRSEVLLHPDLRSMSAKDRNQILDKSLLEASSSVRIIWLLLGFSVAYITAAIVIPLMLGRGPSMAMLIFIPLMSLVPYQIHIHVAIAEEIANWKQLKIAERGEA
jgi:hypothetical protein